MRRLSGSAKSDHMPVQIEALDGSNIHLEIWVRLRELNSFSLLFFTYTRNYGALRAPPLLAPAPRGHYRYYV